MRANKRRRRAWWAAIGVAAAVALCGCGGGGRVEDQGVTRTTVAQPKQPAQPPREDPTTSSPDNVVAPDEPTTDGRHEPVYVDGNPQVTVTPTRAPAGTRVRVDGYGFTGAFAQPDDATLWLAEIQGGCALFARAEHDLHVDAGGHLSGSFVVPATGICRYSTGDEVDTAGLSYYLAYGCTACRIGTFTVIRPGESMEEPTGTQCDTVVFGSGEDAASDVHADGLSCEEAESFLRDHAGPTGALNGLAHIEAEGFVCDRTGQSDVHLPRSNYKCTRGSEAIFFIRT